MVEKLKMEEDIELINWDTANEEVYNLDVDRQKLMKKIGDNTFFNPENDKTYTITLTTPTIVPVTKTFTKNGVEQEMKKFLLQIKAIDRDKNEFEGTWEIGSGTLRKIVNIFKANEKAIEIFFNLTKTGSGLDTKYNIVREN
jgi:hypothetical protein